jgi:hypothetical protein
MVQCNSHLLQIVLALRPTRRLASRLDCRQQKRDEDAYDGDDDEQFDESEPVRMRSSHGVSPAKRLNYP